MPTLQSAFSFNANEVMATIGNFIISQQVFSDNIGTHQTLVEQARVEGGLYGDKKLYYATDALETHAWGGDSEASNLLNISRPKDPQVQAITINVFRQIDLTTDQYLSKRAFSDEGIFSEFISVLLGWMRDTKKVYDGTTYNVYIGTTLASGAKQTKTYSLTSGKEGVEMGENIANLYDELCDYSRDFNDYGNLRSYSGEKIKIIWNSTFANKIKNIDLPSLFHNDELKKVFSEEKLPARYFGHALVAGTDVDSSTYKAASGVVIRASHEIVVGTGSSRKHYFAGDVFDAATTFGSGKDVALTDGYAEDAKIIGKVVVVLPPYMSGFEANTRFNNPKSLTDNNYLTFGHNTIEYLKNYPFITLKKS